LAVWLNGIHRVLTQIETNNKKKQAAARAVGTTPNPNMEAVAINNVIKNESSRVVKRHLVFAATRLDCDIYHSLVIAAHRALASDGV
jgi:CHASE2 domain-containing sensor protein